MLKLGRDSEWPLKIAVASAIDEFTSLSVTYAIDWDGIDWKDDEKSTSWCWSKSIAAAQEDGLTPPPALQRRGAPWNVAFRKENNSFRIILRENTKSTPEEPGEPVMIIFATKEIVKFRSEANDAKERLINCISILYQGRYWLTEQLITREWAMAGSLGERGGASGKIPQHFRTEISEEAERSRDAPA
jgi:hypothetical protein